MAASASGPGCESQGRSLAPKRLARTAGHMEKMDMNQSTRELDSFQDGNGNGNFGEINSNNFEDGNWESMEMKV